jgi:alpha-L-arabinofuranosidase
MRGPRELREPLRTYGTGGKQSGFPTSAGWSLVEAAIQAELMDVDSVLTLHNSENNNDLGDFVEYLFGNTSSTSSKWAKLRVADGHPSPFDPTRMTFEIGNEINTPNWSERATAMETRAKALGIEGILKYAAPDQTMNQFLNVSDPRMVALGAQAMIDIHWGATCSREGLSESSGRKYSAQLDAVRSKARLVVYETNTRCHDFTRVLCEATDMNDLHRSGMSPGKTKSDFRVDQRMQSFCMEISGHDEALTKPGYRGDQGSIFVLPNMTYNQPPFYVHSMIKKSWQEYSANATVVGVDATSPLNVFASMDVKGETVTLRVVNSAAVAVNASVQLLGSSALLAPTTSVLFTTLTSGAVGISADNPSYDPKRYSPKTAATVHYNPDASFTFPSLSFTTIEFTTVAATS